MGTASKLGKRTYTPQTIADDALVVLTITLGTDYVRPGLLVSLATLLVHSALFDGRKVVDMFAIHRIYVKGQIKFKRTNLFY